MINAYNIENKIEEVFGKIPLNTISSVSENRIRIENSQDDLADNKLSFINSMKILESIFEDKEVWIQIVLWKDNSLDNLIKCGFNKTDFSSNFNREIIFNEANVIVKYLHLNKFSVVSVTPFIKAVINYDLGIDPLSDITCFYLNFDIPALVNIYDDRGIDVLTSNEKIKTKLNGF